ncbi:enoyl-[acyl-carrier protein] reductase I [Methylacidimicrobium cyclopophantes]|uniref:Enoyl-[acyl-carrier-protein] reductase [NADH] n=1 Tax=Methylacidimicrobium cyclopophantes TaxID=1041766 RepID=A0A5E6MA74_9BACT|nr:enoyl-ACP reductase [Methylacidimicrobium cyclopophantes]VVM06442.1 enoyl-[acyl-carrier protein] reductase I [Methylacidimicrobium cyclopophantes]
MNKGLLEGKTALIFGVANRRSLAWGIAQAWGAEGASLILGYQGERLRENVEELAASLPKSAHALCCDVADDGQIEKFFAAVSERSPSVDLVLHSIAFAPKEALEHEFSEVDRDDFRVTFDISVYSFLAIARRAKPLMSRGGLLLTLTYYGSEKVTPHYHIMGAAKAALEASVRYLAYEMGPLGIRVNALSPGPVNTLAARGISGFTQMLKHHQDKAPLRKPVDPAEVGATALFLATEGAGAITGQTLYVDCGYSILGA